MTVPPPSTALISPIRKSCISNAALSLGNLSIYSGSIGTKPPISVIIIYISKVIAIEKLNENTNLFINSSK